MVLTRLALSNFSTRKVRVVLTIAAIALSVSLVVSVTSGYASVEAAAFKFLSMYMGTHDAQLTRTGDLRGGIRESVCDELVADPDVKGVLRISFYSAEDLDRLKDLILPDGISDFA